MAKTLAVKTFAGALGVEFQRIQFTPDLVPADIVGTRIYNQKLGEFEVSLGPIFANLVLADEINRAPAKVQSALLEAMQERQVTIGRETHVLPDPFLVMATQNPIESDGTYPLPEAQVDRFMLKVLVDYPSATEEFVIVERMVAGLETVRADHECPSSCAHLQQAVRTVYVDPSLIEYAVAVASATRDPASVGLPELSPYITFGVSPRASINMVIAAQALALVRGRQYVLPEDVRTIAPDVLRHRLVLSYEALADDVTAQHVIDAVLSTVPVPDVVLRVRQQLVREDAMDPADLLTPERVLRRLEWQVVRRLDGRLQGDYRTLLRGDGTDFLDLRAYEWGDDVRHIDWNATARMDELLVREFMEDRELTAWLLLDRSRSMTFGPAGADQGTRAARARGSLRPAARRGTATGSAPSSSTGTRHWVLPPAARPEPGPRAAASPAPTGRCGGVDRPRQALPHGRATRASTVARGGDLRLHQRARLGTTAPPPHAAPRGRRGPDGGSARVRAPDAGLLYVQDAETGEQLLVDSSDPELRRRLHAAG